MSERLHLDCFSGLAGDMFLGACLDLGMPLAVVEEAVAALDLPGVGVEAQPARRGGLAGTRFRVLVDGRPLEGPDPEEPGPHDHPGHDHPGHQHPEHRHPGHQHPEHQHPEHQHPEHDQDPPSRRQDDADHGSLHAPGPVRDLAEIRELIGRGGLAAEVRERALQLFARLGEAEARAHGIAVDEVHFHEVGAVDSIVDLVGAAAALAWLRPERVSASPVNVGGGTVRTAHGVLPVPAPATAWLMRGLPIYGAGDGELLTPTGAVLLAELVDELGPLPAMTLEAAGYGLGRKHTPGRANAVRLLRGRSTATTGATGARVVVIEAEVDDLPGEGFGFLMERLLAEGALDVYFTPVQMKKSRPGTLITVLCRPGEGEALAARLLAESGSLGCRLHETQRIEAEREVVVVATRFGEIRVKRARLAGRPVAEAPEFEDCRRLALAAGVPWREVYRAAVVALARAVEGAG